jgi:predicted O-methyltransferase YrrM
MTEYFVEDLESEDETARLIQLHTSLSRHLGGGFPPPIARSEIRQVLDVGCGPGHWALDLAACLPSSEVTGIDTSATRIASASSQAHARGLSNVRFLCLDASQPLSLPDASFDLIHARFVQSFLPMAAWPLFLAECQRLLRPGGLLVLVECENPISTSPALERLNIAYANACRRAGTGYTPSGSGVGITAVLSFWLRQAGYARVQDQVQAIDFSCGTAAHADLLSYFQTLLPLTTPFLVRMGAITPHKADILSQQALAEITTPGFCAIWYFRSVWGERSV